MRKPPMRSDQTDRLPAELSGRNADIPSGPSVRSALLVTGTIFVIVLTLLAASVFYPQLQEGSTVVWTAAFVLLVAIAQLVASSIAESRKTPVTRSVLWVGGAFVLRVVLVGVLVAGLWVLVPGGGAEWFGATIAAQFEPPVQGATIPAKPPATPGVVVARRRLKEIRPDVYATATDLNSPQISPEPNARTAYTWTFVKSGSAKPATFTVTLDVQGRVVTK